MEGKSKFEGELAELKARGEIIPYKKASLFREFNKELTFGSPQKAEEYRGAISKLEEESKLLSSEIEKLENEMRR